MEQTQKKGQKLTEEQKKQREKTLMQKRRNEKMRREYYDFYDDVKTSIKQDW